VIRLFNICCDLCYSMQVERATMNKIEWSQLSSFGAESGLYMYQYIGLFLFLIVSWNYFLKYFLFKNILK